MLTYRVSHETWQMVNSLECLLPKFVKLFDTEDNNANTIRESCYSKTGFKVKYVPEIFNQINCKKPLLSNKVYKRRHS